MLRVVLKLFLFLMRDERRFLQCDHSDYTLLAFLMEFERLVLRRITRSGAAFLFNFHSIAQFTQKLRCIHL